jgi:hypothetical protein
MRLTILRHAALLAMFALLTTTGLAAAAPTTGTVLVGRGIEGVELGASQAQAEAVLGAPDDCSPNYGLTRCTWTDPASVGFIAVEFNDADGGVTTKRARKGQTATASPAGAVRIEVTMPGYATAEGIGFNSGSSQIIDAYGDLINRNICNFESLCLLTRDGAGRAVATEFNLGYHAKQAVQSITVRYRV